MSDAYFFGCLRGIGGHTEAGHFLHTPGYDSAYRNALPFRYEILDGPFAPPRVSEAQSAAALTVLHGWTILAMWDRSGDARGASNAAFVARGVLLFHEMCAIAAHHFPEVWARINAAAPVEIVGGAA